VTMANFSFSNQLARILRVGIKRTATPRPTIVLPRIALKKVGDKPNRIAPSAATSVKRVTVFFGPRESLRSPEGICIRA
ncbi:unnamed protein product, partial [marine sediment metagenome]